MRNTTNRITKIGFAVLIMAVVFAVPNVSYALIPSVPDVISDALLYILNLIINFIGSFLIGIGASVVNYVFKAQSFVKVPAVQIGWTVSRDLANMGFILALLGIAFATVLKMEDSFGFNIKKSLPRLVAMALLLNFSLLICGAIIDIGNSLTYYMAIGGANPDEVNVGDNIMYAVKAGGIAQIRNNVGAGNGIINVFIVSFAQLIFYIFLAFLLIALAIMMIYRMVKLWILIILSPLAWVSSIFPGKLNYYQKWWGDFLKQVFWPVAMSFFIFIGMITGANFIVGGSGEAVKDVGGFWGTLMPNTSFSIILQFIVVLMILYMGLMSAQQFGASAAGTMIKWTKGAKDWGLGKLKVAGIGGFRAAKGLPMRAADKITSGGATRRLAEGREWLEKVPAIGRAVGGPGTRYAAQQKALKESSAKFAKLRPNDIEARLKQAALTPQGLADRAGMVQALVDKGQFTLHEKPEFKDSWLKMLQTFQNNGGSMTDLLKKRPSLMENADIQKMIVQDVNTPPPVKAKWNEVLKKTDPAEKEELLKKIHDEDIIKTAADFAGVQKEEFDRKGKLDQGKTDAYKNIEDQKETEKTNRDKEAEVNKEKAKELDKEIESLRNRGLNYQVKQQQLDILQQTEKTAVQKYMQTIKGLETQQVQITGRTGQEMFLRFVSDALKKNGSLYAGSLNSLASKNKGAHIELLKHLKMQAPGMEGEWKDDVFKHVTTGLVMNTMIDPNAQQAAAPAPATP